MAALQDTPQGLLATTRGLWEGWAGAGGGGGGGPLPVAEGVKRLVEAVVSGIGERRLRCAKPVEPDERVGATGALARHWQDPLLVCAAPQLQPQADRN
jgi:hypothetical protein